MIRKPSPEWIEYCTTLSDITKKSNREILCTECWMYLNYEQKTKHKNKFPHHKQKVLTPTQFANGDLFYRIALTNNKVIEKEGDGHTNLIEEVCREAHSPPSDTQKGHVTENPSQVNEKFCSCNQFYTRIDGLDSCCSIHKCRAQNLSASLDIMISDIDTSLRKFEIEIASQFSLTSNSYAPLCLSMSCISQEQFIGDVGMELKENSENSNLHHVRSTEYDGIHSGSMIQNCSPTIGSKKAVVVLQDSDSYPSNNMQGPLNTLPSSRHQTSSEKFQKLPRLN